MYHFRKTRQKYLRYPKTDTCDFCDPKKLCQPVLEETEHCFIIYNRTFYDVWELRRVEDHRMVIPKRHVLSIDELNEEERLDLVNVLAAYEKQHYNVYARAPSSITRSLPHQHTHLLKVKNHFARGMFVWRKPYILWLFR